MARQELVTGSPIAVIDADAVLHIGKEIGHVREDVRDCTYLAEAKRVLPVKGYRSAIGSYWNAVVDDLRRKAIHRSLDLFNKEMKFRKAIERYEDFQDHVTDHDLIEGAYKIGVLSWEARKMLQQARETRNLFDGHPQSSEPGLLKVLSLISDCNKYVLSEEFPPSIIDISEYIALMDSANFARNELAVDQAFSDLPQVYKSELINRLYSSYEGENISSDLRGNIEFSAPILWKALTREDKTTIGKRFDKTVLSGDSARIARGQDFMQLVGGLMYVSIATRRILVEPIIKSLAAALDDWSEEGSISGDLRSYSSFIPVELLPDYVAAITKTYVGYRGSSPQWSRTTFYSNAAAPIVKEMFESFDSTAVDAFVDVIRTDAFLRRRIAGRGQLNRLRVLGQIALDKGLGSDLSKRFLELLVDDERTGEFYDQLPQVEE
ncbi:hypothetical protein [Xanthomonas campestris]|uniref:hypothetical protein n=1 Tax=Xanthomonas campestris TaxID=339 RepID=UPI001F174640|nr:hypothetical protein [Xanthomonas campestris]MEA9840079.1 hypothetical protein [Xanthomonas campestris pv. raphani]MEA9877658.1 hypothetical protein [Xanthomonas campestris pv. raphani]MEA9892173.1 hypothetical protein [Xanthomonas campestris pv. raphani]MEA9932927.1 hypothetical protein [Xanthomonas campestris pv. raphani]